VVGSLLAAPGFGAGDAESNAMEALAEALATAAAAVVAESKSSVDVSNKC
jgi:hypothetical protein